MRNEVKIKALVDRMEGDKAVILLGEEEQDAVDFPKNFLPEVKDGDILTFKIKLQSRKTKEAKAKVQGMIDRLSNRN